MKGKRCGKTLTYTVDMKYNVYQIREKRKDIHGLWADSVEFSHKLILKESCFTMDEALKWLEDKGEEYVEYTILPIYVKADWN